MLDKSVDEEIKKRLKKDVLISKKAEDVFENFFKGEENMENQSNNKKEEFDNVPNKENKQSKFYKWRKPLATAACLTVLLGGGNIYASTQGYGNVFFLIKYLVTGDKVEVTDKDEILSDRDITISYEPINIVKGLSITVKKIQIKDSEAKLTVVSSEKDVLDSSIVPLKFKVYNSENKMLCQQVSAREEQNSGSVTDELILKDYKNTDNILNLEIYKANSEQIATLKININDKTIEVLGEKEALKKISEIELKQFLGFASGLSQKGNDTENEIKIDLACRMLSVNNPDSEQYIVINDLISYPVEEVDKMIESFLGEKIKNFKDGKLIKISTKNGKKYYTYATPSDVMYGGECINISNISYCNGLYTVKYTYYYRGGEPDEDVDMNNYDIYEQEICISLNENSDYSKFRVVSKEQPTVVKSAVENNSAENESTTDISKTEAEKILKEKFQIIENLYLSADTYFELEDVVTEQGRRILNYEQKLKSDFTENMIKEIENNNLPWGLNFYNGMQFVLDVGGYIPYNGMEGFKNIVVNSNYIKADVVTKQISPSDKELSNRTTQMGILKDGNSWLIDNFDVNIFLANSEDDLGEVEETNTSNNENITNTTNTTNSIFNTTNSTINTQESTNDKLNNIKRYFIQANNNAHPTVKFRKYENETTVKDAEEGSNILNTFLGKINDKITNIDNTTTYNEWCNREIKPTEERYLMMFMYNKHQTQITWNSNNENEIDMLWFNDDKKTIEIDKIQLNTNAKSVFEALMEFYGI